MSNPSETAASPAAPVIEESRGKNLLLRSEAKRCIHSRQCVLGAPAAFKANVQGPWLDADGVPVEHLVAIAEQCPSGAITYERLDGGPQESAPPINVARLRENGPVAIHAQITIEGLSPAQGNGKMFRAVLCRCGASKNKPFCDSSHIAAGFQATGEPATQESQPLAVRGGELTLTPFKDGPLGVKGSLEICAGTGRTLNRVTKTALCRCGHSSNKPYCDGTHAKIGFKSE